jgi:quercetin dioxygenase-like cupin family protein
METDERGASFFFFPEAVDIDLKSLQLVVTRPGQVRGNHAHPTRTEYLFCFGGQAEFYWEEGGEVRRMELGEEGRLLRIAPGTKHAYRNTGNKPTYILACWGPRLSEGPDRVGAKIVPEGPVGHA